MAQGQTTISQLISDYNNEVGKDRPDFRTLMRYHAQMQELDPNRVQEMARSIDSRSKTISVVVVGAVEDALMHCKPAQADEEFRYCLRNRSFLSIPAGQFERLEGRVSACVRSHDELQLIKSAIDSVDVLMLQTDIAQARSTIASINGRFADIKGFVQQAEATALSMALLQLEARIGQLEDSLVHVNMAILSAKGADAAESYLRKIVQPAGVSTEKVARIDQAILAAAPPDDRKIGVMGKEVDAVASASEADGNRDVFAEMQKKAVVKAKARQDSIRTAEELRARIAQAQRDSAEAAAKATADREFKEQRKKTLEIASEIDRLIKKNKGRVACDLFSSKQSILQEYLMPDAFAQLAARVEQLMPHWESGSQEAQLIAATPVAAQQAAPDVGAKAKAIIESIYDMIEHSDAKGAYARFDSEKKFLESSLDKETYEMLRVTVVQAHESAR